MVRFIQVSIIFFIKLFKKTTKLSIFREGINWFVDLNEGIDFSIFLIGKFEIKTRIMDSYLWDKVVKDKLGLKWNDQINLLFVCDH